MTLEERVTMLESRADRQETWAGPGQASALAEGLQDVRATLGKIQATQDRHTRMLADLTSDVVGLKTDVAGLQADVADLKTDVAGLKTDMTEVKGTLSEILRRLPPEPSSTGGPVGAIPGSRHHSRRAVTRRR